MKGRFDRARRAITVGYGRTPSLVGKENEDKTARVRRAAEGIVYWQKEVIRLEEQEGIAMRQ